MKESKKISLKAGAIIVFSTAIGFLGGVSLLVITKPVAPWIFNNVIFFTTFAGLTTGMVLSTKMIFSKWLPLWREEVIKQIEEEKKS